MITIEDTLGNFPERPFTLSRLAVSRVLERQELDGSLPVIGGLLASEVIEFLGLEVSAAQPK